MLIDWSEIQSLCPDITGIIHVGAYNGEEKKVYGDIPAKWVEADPELYKALTVSPKYHFAALSYNGTTRFNIMQFKPANSVLEPNINAKRRKDVRVLESIIVPARMVKGIQESGYNMLVADIQGAELQMLRGADLSMLDYLILEVHTVETYHGVPHVGEIDAYLMGFTRVRTEWTKHGWGDAVYIKDSVLQEQALQELGDQAQKLKLGY